MNKYEILHCHTTYSNASTIDSTLSIQSLANRIKEIGGTALCITEHGNMLSKFDANITAKKNGLKFIQGCEFYFVKDRLAETEGKTIDKKTKLPAMIKDGTNSHMIMLAKNQNGVIAMNRLISYANIDGFYYKPRIDFDLINKFVNEEDVIITTACIGSFINKYEFDIINEFDRFIKAGNFFLEIQAHNTKEQKEFNKKLVALAKEKNIPLTFGTDSHAVTEDDELYRDLLLKRKNIVYDDEQGWYLDMPTLEEAKFRLFEQSILSEDEINECLNNTNKIVESISNYDISEYHLRDPVQKKYKEYDIEKRFEILKDIVYNEFNKYCEIDEYANTNRLKYIDEIEYELNEIHGCSMQDYFLLNYEIIKRGKELGGKLTYTSRGSAPCYITNKFLGFTSIDRLQFNLPLIPQRFMTKERILLSHTAPDVDMNVENADPFIEATRELLGSTNAYPMIALGRVQEKTGWKIYAGVNAIPIEVANEVSKSIDEYLTAKKYAGDDSEDIELEDYIPEQYIKEFNNSIHFRSVIENIKPHPCGTLVSPDDLIDNVGLIKIKDKICAAIEGSTAEKLGYLKEDLKKSSIIGIWC